MNMNLQYRFIHVVPCNLYVVCFIENRTEGTMDGVSIPPFGPGDFG